MSEADLRRLRDRVHELRGQTLFATIEQVRDQDGHSASRQLGRLEAFTLLIEGIDHELDGSDWPYGDEPDLQRAYQGASEMYEDANRLAGDGEQPTEASRYHE